MTTAVKPLDRGATASDFSSRGTDARVWSYADVSGPASIGCSIKWKRA
ncbi:MAG: hypothetical protein ABIQ60_13410 [Burkholderiaceae bacterium]